jgi:hypothetical protein
VRFSSPEARETLLKYLNDKIREEIFGLARDAKESGDITKQYEIRGAS